MNIKQIFRTLLVIAVLSTLVILGMTNQQPVELWPPRYLFQGHPLRLPAAYMYFSFLGLGILVGTFLMVGGGKKGGK